VDQVQDANHDVKKLKMNLAASVNVTLFGNVEILVRKKKNKKSL